MLLVKKKKKKGQQNPVRERWAKEKGTGEEEAGSDENGIVNNVNVLGLKQK